MENESNRTSSDSALMATNGLLYRMPQQLSVCVNRTFKKEYAQRTQCSETDTIVFDINTGSSYVDPASCMLSFELKVESKTSDPGDTFSFGSGMATNIIKEIRILSKNGCEVDRTQNANVLAKILKDYTYSKDSQGMLSNAGLGLTYASDTTHTFVIPLPLISGLFRPTVHGMKIPAGLMSGMRIEFITEKARRAITYVGAGTNVSYTVSNPEMLFQCMDLNDPTQAVLMKNSAETGLEYTFPSYFSSPHTTAGNSVNEQVKKAVAQCTRAFTTVFNKADVSDEKKDGFNSLDATAFETFQYRVGSNYYPQKAVSNLAESWYVTSSAFKCNFQDVNNAMSLADYKTGGNFVMGIPLETDSRLNLSGLPTNNSNVLEVRIELDANGVDLEYIIFIEHVTVARTFINATSIKI
jgi:hypothetical protein